MSPSISLKFLLFLFAKSPCKQDKYRAFRAWMLQGIPDEKAKTGRMKIRYFRRQVEDRAVRLAKQNRDLESVILRSLRIPYVLPILKPWWFSILLLILSLLAPKAWLIRQFQAYFRMTRTNEGKALLFDRFKILSLHSDVYFDEATKQLLDTVNGFRSIDEFKTASYLPAGLIRAALGLGLCIPAEIIATMTPYRSKIDDEAVAILVDEGILTCAKDLKHLPFDDYIQTMRDGLGGQPEVAEHFRDTVRLLHGAGVPCEIVMRIFSHRYSLNPTALSVRLKHIEAAGILDIATLYKGLGETLWNARDSVFDVVIGPMGIHDAKDIVQFKRLLQSNDPPSLAVVEQLRQLGAAACDFEQCQDILIETAKIECVPIERISESPRSR